MSKHYVKCVTHSGAIIRKRERGWQVEINRNKRRIRHTEDTLEKAKSWAAAETTRLDSEGTAALSLSEDHRHDALRALRLLPSDLSLEAVMKEYVAAKAELDGTPLSLAVAFWKSHHKPAGGVRTVNELLDEYVRVKSEKGKRQRYVKDIAFRVGMFAREFGDRHVHTITTQDINEWIKQKDYHGTTQINYLTYLTGFFNFAKRMRLIEGNPADSESIERPDVDEKTTEVFSVDCVASVMTAAGKHAPAIVPMLALGFFAGLRTSELQGITWDAINFESKRIRVVPSVAKKRRQRFIAMQDNLIAWLLPYRQSSGPVAIPFMTYRRSVDRVLKATGVKWVQNGMRHTFASCHLAKFQDMKRLVIEMGHADKADVLFGHYLDLVTPEDAERYWNIRPVSSPAPALPEMAQAL